MSKRQLTASKVLDYWFSIEFLSQESYESTTERKERKKKAKDFKNKLHKEKSANDKQIVSVIDLEENSLYGQILEEARSLQMPLWGNITLYLGKIKRENCIEALARKMNISLDDIHRAEKNHDDIVIASLQLNERGQYIPHTLSLSTVVWALGKIVSNPSLELSNALSKKAYESDLKALENKFLSDEIETDIPAQSAPIQDASTDNAAPEPPAPSPSFEPDAVTIKRLSKLFEEICTGCPNEIFMQRQGNPKNFLAKAQFFKDLQVKDKYESDEYIGLSHDYFSNDINLVRKAMESEATPPTNMLESLLSYINVPNESSAVPHGKRIDLVHTGNPMRLQHKFQEILSIENAPLAKWPSKYMPAFMQQLAVNLAIHPEISGSIFSVNGPPGTGKTTLLKEIIANHVVEKAHLLAKIETPDDAFEEHSFLQGEKTEHAYSKFWSHWYSFKPEYDKINDYGILVASCNNAAVENITKELPIQEKILQDLHPGQDDPEDTKKMLDEISNMFSVEASEKVEHLFVDTKEEADVKEIFFSGYASKLLKDEAWGLIAATLGKRKNINDFYHNVMKPLLNDLVKSNKQIEHRKQQYKECRNAFLRQLKKVRALRRQLTALSQAATNITEKELTSIETADRCEATIEHIRETLELRSSEGKEISESLEKAVSAEENFAENVQSIHTEKQTLNEEKQSLIDQIEALRKKIVEANNSVSFIEKIMSRLWKTTAYQDAEALADHYRTQIPLKEASIAQIQSVLDSKEAELHDVQQNLDKAKREKAAIISRKENFEKETHALERDIEDCLAKIDKAKAAALHASETFLQLKADMQARGKANHCTVLDSKFAEDLLSSDALPSTEAHVSNPWLTETYNREREKLFGAALRLNRDFVLSSKAFRCNLHLLGMYWGLENEDNERVNFSPQDKHRAVAALFQSLFLLVPVISSTFASIGKLFQDVIMPGSLGTLIVDESGQAQPQMALGALFRSRHAIIVGDPKQVEPVVTDDLQLLKNAFSQPLYTPYKDKTLSVQSFADALNPFGTYLDNGTDQPDWVGCPLLVHRRCISPMYDISNIISYDKIMKQKTASPSKEMEDRFIFEKSQWINVAGRESGNHDHYVPSQSSVVCIMVERAFEKAFPLGKSPSLFIISPFTTVTYGITKALRDYRKSHPDSFMAKNNTFNDFVGKNIGTVHKFQGKEANEVIFLLGCDETAEGAIQWVNKNIINVAVTRAKYRLYVVGNQHAWRKNGYISIAKDRMDILPLKRLHDLLASTLPEEEKKEQILSLAKTITPSSSFVTKSEDEKDENGDPIYSIDTDRFVSGLNKENFLNQNLSKEQLEAFGFASAEELMAYDPEIRENLEMGMKLYYLLRPVYEMQADLDASCCGILFCKALELQLRNNFVDGLKACFPDHEIKKNRVSIPLKDASNSEFMIGVIHNILIKKKRELCSITQSTNAHAKNPAWWDSFIRKLKQAKDERNSCCHPQKFGWAHVNQLIQYEFRETQENSGKIGGIFFESEIGKQFSPCTSTR